ncbi:MAG: hypothetical protein R2860_03620 [Desulfobacterales bacterium]
MANAAAADFPIPSIPVNGTRGEDCRDKALHLKAGRCFDQPRGEKKGTAFSVYSKRICFHAFSEFFSAFKKQSFSG